MSNWIYKGIPFDESLIGKNAGFVYIITDLTTNKRYIGRKYFTFSRKKTGKNRRSSFESDWKDYYSSSKELQRLVEEKGKDNFQREIITLGKTRGQVNFLEVVAQFHFRVLESDQWLNDSINKWRKSYVSNYSNINEIYNFSTNSITKE